jgi:hypothetical protein
MPKGEKILAQSKRTAPPPIFKIKEKVFKMMIFQIGILKTPWTLRGGFYSEGVCLVKWKAFETGGENFKILFICLIQSNCAQQWPAAILKGK